MMNLELHDQLKMLSSKLKEPKQCTLLRLGPLCRE